MKIWEPPSIYRNTLRFIESELFITDKRGRLRPLVPNRFQRRYLEEKAEVFAGPGKNHILVLKSRQGGITTLEQALSYELVASNPYKKCATIAEDLDSTISTFGMCQLFHQAARPGPAKPPRSKSNARELLFHDGTSRFYIGTAGNDTFGRGQTFQRFHGTEVAFWKLNPDRWWKLVDGIVIAANFGEIVLETTAHIAGDPYHELWKAAKDGTNSFSPIFLAWWHDDDCRLEVTEKEAAEILSTLERDELTGIERHGWTVEQVAWRRKEKKARRHNFPREFPENDDEAFLYAGDAYFDLEAVDDQWAGARKILRTKDNGRLVIWQYPQPGVEYVAGADSSSGVPGGDPSSMGILRADTGEQVAALHGFWKPHEFAEKLAKLGKIYNYAILGIEINNHGHATMQAVRREQEYPTSRIFKRTSVDVRTRTPTFRYGWDTTEKTRAQLISELDRSMRTGEILCNDLDFLAECRAFVLSKNGKYEAAPGKHDDRVIAWGIANSVRRIRFRALMSDSEGEGGAVAA